MHAEIQHCAAAAARTTDRQTDKQACLHAVSMIAAAHTTAQMNMRTAHLTRAAYTTLDSAHET